MSVNVFEFTSPEYFSNKKIANYNWEIRKTNRFEFINVKSLDQSLSYDLILDVRCPAEKIMMYDVLPNNFWAPLVKGKALEILLEICPESFQVFEAEVQATDGSLHDYKILNLLEEIAPVNYEKSDTQYYDDGLLMGFKKLVMHSHAMEGHHLGRLKDAHSWILASETIQKAFKKARIKGVKFEEIETA